ncbi:hypothetical protein [Streptomyces melanogenes]|uniref:Transcriptional regulator n=1 Tax=Streptomyces melanogenes TaxID=67326 RepID=A0ABZ1XUX3_9ACTN|nr:hypothetical protein [Streptomyces melanogenes]
MRPYLLWHRRYDDDRAHAWLRDLATETIHTFPEARPDRGRH